MQRCAFIFCNSNIYSIYSRCSLTLLLRHNHSEFVHDFSVIKRTLHSGCTQLKHLHAIFSLQLPDGLLLFFYPNLVTYMCTQDAAKTQVNSYADFQSFFFFPQLSSVQNSALQWPTNIASLISDISLHNSVKTNLPRLGTPS